MSGIFQIPIEKLYTPPGIIQVKPVIYQGGYNYKYSMIVQRGGRESSKWSQVGWGSPMTKKIVNQKISEQLYVHGKWEALNMVILLESEV